MVWSGEKRLHARARWRKGEKARRREERERETGIWRSESSVCECAVVAAAVAADLEHLEEIDLGEQLLRVVPIGLHAQQDAVKRRKKKHPHSEMSALICMQSTADTSARRMHALRRRTTQLPWS